MNINRSFTLLSFLLEQKKQAKMIDLKPMLNFSYMNTNENIYFLQRNVKPTTFLKESKKTLFQKNSEIPSNATNDQDSFLKKKLLDKGNKLIKDSVLDCSDPNNVLPVQTVCSLCNV